MRRPTLNAVLVVVASLLLACSKAEDGQLQVQVPDVDIKVRRDTLTIPAPELPGVDPSTRRDTLTMPPRRIEIRPPAADAKRP